ncbi:MAG: AMP-binding protein [Dehalococcoidia bacterium]
MHVPMLVSDFLRRAVDLILNVTPWVCGATRYTYAQFNERANRPPPTRWPVGRRQRRLAALLAPNVHRFLECFYGVTAIGAVLVPLNYWLVPSDFIYIVNHAEATAFIIDDELTAIADEIRPELRGVRHFISWSGRRRRGGRGPVFGSRGAAGQGANLVRRSTRA